MVAVQLQVRHFLICTIRLINETKENNYEHKKALLESQSYHLLRYQPLKWIINNRKWRTCLQYTN